MSFKLIYTLLNERRNAAYIDRSTTGHLIAWIKEFACISCEILLTSKFSIFSVLSSLSHHRSLCPFLRTIPNKCDMRVRFGLGLNFKVPSWKVLSRYHCSLIWCIIYVLAFIAACALSSLSKLWFPGIECWKGHVLQIRNILIICFMSGTFIVFPPQLIFWTNFVSFITVF